MTSSTSRPYVDEEGRTDAETYLMGVLDGTIVAGEKIVKLAEKMLPRIRDGYKQWHYSVKHAIRPVRFIENFIRISSGSSSVPLILEPYERMIVELTFGFVDDEGLRQIRYTLVLMARKQGKALSLDTEIPTPDGWRTMRDIHVGDTVFGQDGKPSLVTAESDVFYDKPTYLVTFEDGSSIKATDDHVWTVHEHGWLHKKRDMTTKELFDDFDNGRYFVPLCDPVEYEHKNLPQHPYNIGYAAVVFDGTISEECLTSSVKQRFAVLEGVRGALQEHHLLNPIFSCEEHANRIVELCASLGVPAKPFEHDGVFGVDFNREGVFKHRWCKAIVSIEQIPNEPTKCIAIDNDSHLYLAGRQYTATHNTTLCAAIELYMLVADGEGAPQIYNIATSRAQASLGFGAVTRMVKLSPELKKRVQRRKVIERAEVGLVNEANLGYIIALSKQPEYLDGLDVHCVIVDEMAAMKDRAVFDLLRQGMGARQQPLLVAITTEGRIRDSLWDSEHEYANRWLEDKLEEEDDRFLGILFEQDSKDEILAGLNDEYRHLWQKSNPGMGTVKQGEYLLGEVVKAKNDPSYMPTVLTKEFNTRANAAASFLSYEEAYNHTTYEYDRNKFRYGIVGLDAADTLDLNAATVLFMTPGDDHIYRRSMYWIAEEQVKVNTISQKGRDGVPYEDWERKGFIRIVPGNKVDRHVFIDWLDELYEDGMFVVGLGHDRWGMKEISDELDMRVGAKNVIPIPFGAQSLSTPMKQLKADMRDGRIIDNDNVIDHWCNANVTVKEDINGNIQPIKLGGPTSRIDGFAALLCAYKILMFDKWDEYQICIGA